jgi:hypothetical protein
MCTSKSKMVKKDGSGWNLHWSDRMSGDFTRHVTWTLRCAALRLGADSALRSALPRLRDDLLPIRRRPTRSMRAMRADGGVILQLDVTARSSFKGLVNMESMRFSIGMLIRNAKLIIEQPGRTSLQRQQRKHTTSDYATLPFRINRRCHTAADY